MKKLKSYIKFGIIFVLTAGTLSHFLYQWSGNSFLVGLFTPINESAWEHMKLLFFPMLLYSLYAVPRLREQYPCAVSSFPLGILLGTLLIPVLFYTYTGIIGKDFFIADILIFIIAVLLAFCIAYKLAVSYKAQKFTVLLCLLVCALTICFLFFTCYPPQIPLFENPT
jgi:hypothetical protein